MAILVNNAGITRPQPIDQITEQDWDEVLAVNLKSVFLVTQAVLPGMRAAKWGRIINLSSVAAQTGGVVGPHYAASKAGIQGLTHSYATLLAKEGITVNAIAPALIETEMIPDNPHARPDSDPGGPVRHRGRGGRRGGHAGHQRLHHRPDDQRQRRLVHELTYRKTISAPRLLGLATVNWISSCARPVAKGGDEFACLRLAGQEARAAWDPGTLAHPSHTQRADSVDDARQSTPSKEHARMNWAETVFSELSQGKDHGQEWEDQPGSRHDRSRGTGIFFWEKGKSMSNMEGDSRKIGMSPHFSTMFSIPP